MGRGRQCKGGGGAAPASRPASGAKGKGGGAGAASAAAPALLPPSSSSATLTLPSDTLGTFTYALTLKAHAPAPESALRFSTPLGVKGSAAFLFRHLEGRAAEYAVAVKGGEGVFSAPATVSVGAGESWEAGAEGKCAVTFEGCQVGTVEGLLTLTSESGGCYSVPLVGVVTPPAPVGPVSVGAGGVTLDFVSPFAAEAEFAVTSEGAAFVLAAGGGKCKLARKGALSIQCKAVGAGAAASRVLVTHTAGGGVKPGAVWVYYVKSA